MLSYNFVSFIECWNQLYLCTFPIKTKKLIQVKLLINKHSVYIFFYIPFYYKKYFQFVIIKQIKFYPFKF